MKPSIPPGDPTRRTIDERRIVDILLVEGWIREMRAGRGAVAEAAARAALDGLVTWGLPHRRSPAGLRLFDPVEVLQFLHWAGPARGDRIFERHFVPTWQRLVWEAHAAREDDLSCPPPAELGDFRYRFVLRRTFNFRGRAAGTRLRLRLPVPLEDARTRDVATAFLPDPETAADIEIAAASVDVRTAVPRSGDLTIGISATLTAGPPLRTAAAGVLDPAEADLYTRPSEGPIKLTDLVRAVAARIAGAETDALAIVRRLWTFMMDELDPGPVDYARIDPDRPVDFVLEQGWYDCRNGSALFVSLCRACGIPARLVSGFCLYPAHPAIHSWFEAWIDGHGWLPFDLLSSDLSFGGRDTGWREAFFGHVNERLATERPPRLFTGGGGARLPPRWHLLSRIDGPGVRFDFREAETDALIYSDHVEVVRGV